MARPGLTSHRKFIRLARILGSDALALGHLEFIWQASYENGDPKIGAGEDLEYLARWRGEPGALARALLESGFVDFDCNNNEFTVHDLHDHAPDYVRRRMEREEERRRKGQTLSALRSKAGKKGAAAKARKQTLATDEQTSANEIQLRRRGRANGATPAPAPAPAPKNKDNPPNPPSGGSGGGNTKRRRNELWDAIVDVGKLDSKLHRTRIVKLQEQLTSAEPPYSPADVRRLPQVLRDRGLTRIAEGLTPELIFKYITWARAPAAGGNSAEINGLHESCGDQATRRASPDALRDFDRQFCNHEPENDDR